MERLLKREPTMTGRQLKASVPALENLSIRRIQELKLKLKLATRKKAAARPTAAKDKRPRRKLQAVMDGEGGPIKD